MAPKKAAPKKAAAKKSAAKKAAAPKPAQRQPISGSFSQAGDLGTERSAERSINRMARDKKAEDAARLAKQAQTRAENAAAAYVKKTYGRNVKIQEGNDTMLGGKSRDKFTPAQIKAIEAIMRNSYRNSYKKKK